MAKTQEVGDYDLRGVNAETRLIGRQTDTIIDADRLTRKEWRNGFPNYFIYRCALAGDDVYSRKVMDWCIAFSIAYCSDPDNLRPKLYSDELATSVGWDAYYMLVYTRPLFAASEAGPECGVSDKTYTRLRNAVDVCNKASLREYWDYLGIAYRRVRMMERKQEAPSPPARVDPWHSGEESVMSASGGCYYTPPAKIDY